MDMILLNQQQWLPKYWHLPMLTNFSRHVLNPQSTEFKFVADKFNLSWANVKNQQPVPVSPALRIPMPPPPSMPARPMLPPPQPPFQQQQQQQPIHVSPATNLPPSAYTPALLQQINQMQGIINNNGPITNQPIPLNHPLRPLLYSAPFGGNPMVQSTSLPPPLPPPPPHAHSLPNSYLQQPIYRPPTISHSRSRVARMPVNNTIVPNVPARSANPINTPPTVIQIERIQNQRWYKQYSAHECEFRQKLGKQTEQWLFHGF